MKKSRFSEEQIIGILKEQEAGLPVAELCRKHGMSDASFYTWKAKYGGLDVSEAMLAMLARFAVFCRFADDDEDVSPLPVFPVLRPF